MPRITVPHKAAQKQETHRQRKLDEALKKKKSRNGPVLISCSRGQFNHHKGQTYSNFAPSVLASGGWKHYKSKGNHFTMLAQQSVGLDSLRSC